MDQSQQAGQATTRNPAQASIQAQQPQQVKNGSTAPGSAPGETQNTQGANRCPVSTVTTDRPANANTAAWSRTWYRSPDSQIWASASGLSYFAAGGDKVLWAKPVGSDLYAEGHHLDGEAQPLQVDMPGGYEDMDYQASGVTFSAPGCWEITAGPLAAIQTATSGPS
ncbi:MAG: hypothetical protein IVW55_06895 [Chloroflexi bacterium]|nr:hypothetical protein [Chloroflexota bacterium]